MTKRIPAPEEIARAATARLRGMADPVRAAGAQKYFKYTIKTFGATAPQIRSLAEELYRSIKPHWTVKDAVALADILFREPELDSKSIGSLILGRFKKDFPESLFAKVKRWLAVDLLDNWASVDGLCPESMGAFLEKYPGYVAKIKTWASHPNRWVKRASAVSFIKLARKDAFRPAVYEIAAALFPAHDDLVEKATGWLLREAGKADMARLEGFLLEHGPAIPRTTLRYAIERFDETTRRRLLESTKPPSMARRDVL